ncbi:hypothetical protein BDY21DRAFT_277458 [Lineolata rhizophorae]|uniref:Uncharacterized protein n=1 Tax=Lineolata rhizophorae TaxID=578093 RepID=A0A6A6PG74_9PEZI|nr:hypothetical protein BDY21DRAFT_277458 [Lineolata rhizophorae]
MSNFSFSAQQQGFAANQTHMLIQNLVLGKVQTVRSMHVGLGSFSLFLAATTLFRILYDAWEVSKLQVHLRPRKFALLSAVHPAETFPLVLAVSVVIQQLILVPIQASSLDSIIVDGCTETVQIVMPAIFLVGYTVLVFGVETAVRSFGKVKFAPRGKWNTPVCIIVLAILLLLTWIPTVVKKSRRFCFGSISWWPFQYAFLVLVILSILEFLFIILGTVIGLQLLRSVNVDPNERIAASRMFYYLLLAILLIAFVIPFYAESRVWDFEAQLTTSRLAEIAITSFGIFMAFIHLLLRANAGRMVLKPLEAPWDAPRRRIRLFGPSDLEMNISGPMALMNGSQENLNRAAEKAKLADADFDYQQPLEKDAYELENTVPSQAKGKTPCRAPEASESEWPLPPSPEAESSAAATMASPKTPPPSSPGHKRGKSSYSLFPPSADDMPRLPNTIYTPPSSNKKRDTCTSNTTMHSVTDVHEASLHLQPPLPMFSAARRHRRDSSEGSSATVQIGLRLSVVPSIADHAGMRRSVTPPPPALPKPVLVRTETSQSSSVDSLGLPIQQPSSPSQSRTHSPTQLRLRSSTVPGDSSTPLPQSVPVETVTQIIKPALNSENSGKYLRDARNKVLPPTPGSGPAGAKPAPLDANVSGLRMNPVGVLSPQRPVTSPKRSAVGLPSSPSQAGGLPLSPRRVNEGVTSPQRTQAPPVKKPSKESCPDGGWI